MADDVLARRVEGGVDGECSLGEGVVEGGILRGDLPPEAVRRDGGDASEEPGGSLWGRPGATTLPTLSSATLPGLDAKVSDVGEMALRAADSAGVSGTASGLSTTSPAYQPSTSTMTSTVPAALKSVSSPPAPSLTMARFGTVSPRRS